MEVRFLVLAGSPAFSLGYSKVAEAISSRLEPGKNNYQVNYLVIHAVYSTAVDCETVLVNEYGSVWGNENRQIAAVSPREMAAIRRMFKTHWAK